MQEQKRVDSTPLKYAALTMTDCSVFFAKGNDKGKCKNNRKSECKCKNKSGSIRLLSTPATKTCRWGPRR